MKYYNNLFSTQINKNQIFLYEKNFNNLLEEWENVRHKKKFYFKLYWDLLKIQVKNHILDKKKKQKPLFCSKT